MTLTLPDRVSPAQPPPDEVRDFLRFMAFAAVLSVFFTLVMAAGLSLVR